MLVPGNERNPEDGPRARPQRLLRERVGAALRERDGGAECVGRANQRADVAGIAQPPESKAGVARTVRKVAPAEDADRPRRMGQRETPASSVCLDVLARDQQLDGLDSGLDRRVAEILAFAGEETRLLALFLALQGAHELELRVVLRGDHPSSQSSQLPWKSTSATSRAGSGQTRSSSSQPSSVSVSCSSRRREETQASGRPSAPRQLERVAQLVVALLRQDSPSKRSGTRPSTRRPDALPADLEARRRSRRGSAPGADGAARNVSIASSSRVARSTRPGQMKLRSRSTPSAEVTSTGARSIPRRRPDLERHAGAAPPGTWPRSGTVNVRRASATPNAPWAYS